MFAMKGILFGVCAVALLAVGMVRQEQANVKLRSDIAQLRSDVQRLASQSSTAAAPAPAPVVTAQVESAQANEAERTELAQLRRDVSKLVSQTQEIAKIAQAAQSTQAATASGHTVDALPVRLTPASEWKNAGKATPAAAIETTLWAAVGGDVETIANSIGLTDAGRREADAMWAQVSDQTRAQYGSPEKLLALMIAQQAAGVTGMQMLGQKELGPDDVGVRMRFGNEQGKTKEDSFLLHRSPSGYQLMLNDAAVKNIAKAIGGGK
jgi:hypothetical protein